MSDDTQKVLEDWAKEVPASPIERPENEILDAEIEAASGW